MTPKTGAALVVMSIVSLIALACGGAAASPTPGAATVSVAVQEWAVVPSVATVGQGTVTFTVKNQGPDDVHEFVIIKTDLSVHELPTDADGAVDEAGGGMEVVDEIEDIAVGATQSVTVTLAAGSYALICNIYDPTEDEAHYQLGMRTAFTVTP